MKKTRPCPDCKGRGAGRGSKPYVPGLPCDHCKGDKVVPDLGPCDGRVLEIIPDQTASPDAVYPGMKPGPCPFPADRAYHGAKLCDGHALGEALKLGQPCPTCGGDPSKGMHRGLVICHGKVMTCSSTQHERDLQELSAAMFAGLRPAFDAATNAASQASESIAQLGEILKENSPLRQAIEDGLVEDVDDGESLSYAAPLAEEELRAIQNTRGPRLRYEFGDDEDDPFKGAKLVGVDRVDAEKDADGKFVATSATRCDRCHNWLTYPASDPPPALCSTCAAAEAADGEDGSIVVEGFRYERADECIMGEEPDEDPGDSCLTDGERNPNINRDLRSYD